MDKKLLIVLLATALIVGPTAYMLGGQAALDSHKHNEKTSEHSGHEHDETLNVDADGAPEIKNLKVEKDPKSGYNVTFEVENFEFTPENASTEHVDGEGHAHIYVDGKKISRLYGTAFHIADLEEGERTIRVSLNSNDHSQLAVDDEAIEATKTVVVGGNADDHMKMMKDSDEADHQNHN